MSHLPGYSAAPGLAASNGVSGPQHYPTTPVKSPSYPNLSLYANANTHGHATPAGSASASSAAAYPATPYTPGPAPALSPPTSPVLNNNNSSNNHSNIGTSATNASRAASSAAFAPSAAPASAPVASGPTTFGANQAGAWGSRLYLGDQIKLFTVSPYAPCSAGGFVGYVTAPYKGHGIVTSIPPHVRSLYIPADPSSAAAAAGTAGAGDGLMHSTSTSSIAASAASASSHGPAAAGLGSASGAGGAAPQSGVAGSAARFVPHVFTVLSTNAAVN